MKSIIAFLLLFCTGQLFAQYPVLSTTSLANPTADNNFFKNGNYAMDVNNERDQYVGLWRYDQDGVLFELKIEKKDKYINKVAYLGQVTYSYRDAVIFKYKLVKNGVTIYDNLNDVIPEGYSSVATKDGQRGYLSGRMLDATRNVVAHVDITKIYTATSEKIFFNLSSGAYTLLNPKSYYEGSGLPLFNIPTNGIVMIKVQ